MYKRFFFVAAWALLILVAVVTIGPLADRPRIAPPGVEHFVAFMLIGGVFLLAHPARPVMVGAGLVSAVVLLEIAQVYAPNRHPELIDAVVKSAGVAAGVCLAAYGSAAYRRMSRR